MNWPSFTPLPPSAAESEWLDEVKEEVPAELWVAAHDVEHGIWTMSTTVARDALALSAPSYRQGAADLRELTEARARELVAECVQYDRAYTSCECTPPSNALRLSERLFAPFDGELRCFTNHNREAATQDAFFVGGIRSDWTFSEPYVLFGIERVVVAWFLAED